LTSLTTLGLFDLTFPAGPGHKHLNFYVHMLLGLIFDSADLFNFLFKMSGSLTAAGDGSISKMYAQSTEHKSWGPEVGHILESFSPYMFEVAESY